MSAFGPHRGSRLAVVGLLLSVAFAIGPALSTGPALFAQETLEERDLALLGPPAGPMLEGAELEAATESVSALMRCPVCQGLSVADSHTESALAMRAKAQALLARGYSGDQVLTYFESSYGEFIRLSPRPEGFNLVVWLMPAIGLLIGVAIVWSRLRRQRGARPAPLETPIDEEAPSAPVADADDELASYRERVRQEIGS